MRIRRTLTPALVVLGAACVLAALETAGIVLRRELQGREHDWLDVGRRELVIWLTFAALAPLAAWMARRWPVRPENWRRRLSLYLAAGPLFCVIHLVMVQLGQGAVGPEPIQFSLRDLAELFGYYVAVECCIFWAIAGSFMLVSSQREARARAVAAARLEASLVETRLRALRTQLHPHFLFNTLNAVSVLAMKGDGARVTKALGQLSELLRAALDDDLPQEIPLARELEFLDRYAAIQRLRFPDRLEIVFDVEDEARAALVPAFVLQPLLENALRHGVDALGRGHVTIAARRDDAHLLLEVRDRGPGFARGHVEGVGLANTRARLELLYGADQRLQCDDAEDGGGRVHVRLPYRAADVSAEALA